MGGQEQPPLCSGPAGACSEDQNMLSDSAVPGTVADLWLGHEEQLLYHRHTDLIPDVQTWPILQGDRFYPVRPPLPR